MMTRNQYILSKIAEEACELAVRATKAMQFGVHEMQVDQPKTNLARVRDEWVDLSVMIQELSRSTGLDMKPLLKEEVDKRIKFTKYYEYSKSLGKSE